MIQTIFNNAYAKHNGKLWNPSFKEFSEQDCQLIKEKKEAKLVFHGKLKNNSRAKPMEVIERDGLVLDFDHVAVDITKRIEEALEGYEYTLTNTHSHDPDNNDHCYRGLIATTESIKKDYKSVYWNLVLDNPKLKAMHDEGMLDVRGEDEARCFFTQSIPPERKDKAFKIVHKGSPLNPNTQIRGKPNKTSSNSEDVFFNDVFREHQRPEIIHGGTGKRNEFEGSKIGELINEHRNKKIVLEEMLVINSTMISPPEPIEEIVRQVDRIWEKNLKDNPDFIPIVDKEVDPFEDIEIFKLTMDNLAIAPPPRKWLIDDFIPQGIVGGVVAQGGTGKSFFALQLCSSVACGFMLYNKWSIGNRGKVVYITGEETSEEVIRRMYYLNRNLPDNYRQAIVDNLHIISFADKYYPFVKKDRNGNIVITPLVEKLTEKLLLAIKDPINLIFVDPISRFRDGEENDNTAGTRFVQALQQIRKGLNDDNTLLCAHHGNKGSGLGHGHHQNDSRGASSVVDGMRFMLKMSSVSDTNQMKLFGSAKTQDERYVDLTVIKTNYTKKLDPIYLKVEEQGILKPVTNLVGMHLDFMILEEIKDSPTSKSNFKTLHSGKDGRYGLAEKELVKKLEELESRRLIKIPHHKNMKITDKGKEFISSGKLQANEDE